jgi:hypothetical protein
MSEPPSTTEQTWPWPDSLDALIAAPSYHTVLFENETVRVLHTRIPPGATAPIHTHRWPCVVFIQSWSDCVRRDHLGNVLVDSRQGLVTPKLNSPTWQQPLPPHSLENIGDAEINTTSVEIKMELRPDSHVQLAAGKAFHPRA